MTEIATAMNRLAMTFIDWMERDSFVACSLRKGAAMECLAIMTIKNRTLWKCGFSMRFIQFLEVVLELNSNHVTVVVMLSFDSGSHLTEFMSSAFGHEQVGITDIKLPIFGLITGSQSCPIAS